MVARIVAEDGCTNDSEAIRKCISEYYKKRFPPYAEPKANREPLTPEDMAERQDAVKKARINLARKAQWEIVDQLKGKAITDDEDPMIEWNSYFMNTTQTQSMNLSMLTPDLVSALYQPSREKVDKARANAGLTPLE